MLQVKPQIYERYIGEAEIQSDFGPPQFRPNIHLVKMRFVWNIISLTYNFLYKKHIFIPNTSVFFSNSYVTCTKWHHYTHLYIFSWNPLVRSFRCNRRAITESCKSPKARRAFYANLYRLPARAFSTPALALNGLNKTDEKRLKEGGEQTEAFCDGSPDRRQV